MALVGNEILYVTGLQGNGQLSATLETTTTGAIAALAATEGFYIVNTPITTAGAGTLSAAGLVGGLITRTGPSAAYSDATDTAVAIIALLPGAVTSETFLVRIKNGTAYSQTLTAGVGVTLPTTNIIGPFSIGYYYVTVTGATTVSFTHLSTNALGTAISIVNPLATALTTAGAGTVTAAGIVGGITLRSGPSAAFSDTTDTATAIIAANPALVGKIGESFLYTYNNNTIYVSTLGGGTGVTVSGITAIPANSWVKYLVTYTAADTITMVAIEFGYFPRIGTFTANGATPVTVTNASVSAGSFITITLKTVGGTVSPSDPYIATITPGTGFTVTGTALDTSVYNYRIEG